MKLYQVDLAAPPPDSNQVVKALRVAGKMPLASAKRAHELLRREGGGTVVAGVELAVAEHIARELGRAGARVVIAESSARSPLVCEPAAAAIYSWTGLRSLEAT